MFGLPSVRIGRLFGIPVEVNASWLFVFVFIVSTLSLTYFPEAYPGRPVAVDVASGVVTSLLFFVSIVLHEMGHSLVARAGGTRISKITLLIFGGVAQMEDEPESPGKEFAMAIAGPGMSFALAVVCFSCFVLMYVSGLSNVWWAPLGYLAMINMSLGLFNLLPGFPLDGGRILRAGLWASTGDLLRATRWASNMGRLLGWILMGVSVCGVVLGNLDLIWFALLGCFLTNMAKVAYRDEEIRSRLRTFTVSSQMSTPAVVAPGEITLQEMVDRSLSGDRHSRYPVAVNGRLIGMLQMDDILEIPRDHWDTITVADVASKDLAEILIGPDATVGKALVRLGPDSPGALLVIENGLLAGVITSADALHALRQMDEEVPGSDGA